MRLCGGCLDAKRLELFRLLPWNFNNLHLGFLNRQHIPAYVALFIIYHAQ